MSENPLETRCAVCGKQFEAHPDSFVDVGFSAIHESEEGAGELIESGDALPHEEWMGAETVAGKLGIEVDDAEKLLEDGEVQVGAEAWCDKCIDEAFTQ